MPNKDKGSVELEINANDTYGLYKTMHSLNQIINGLWILADTRYSLGYVFNASTDETKQISKILSEDEITDLAGKFEHIRAIVLSGILSEDSGNFEEFEKLILDSVWEQKIERKNGENDVKYEKRKVIEDYYGLCKAKEDLEEYYKTRFEEEIKNDEK